MSSGERYIAFVADFFSVQLSRQVQNDPIDENAASGGAEEDDNSFGMLVLDVSSHRSLGSLQSDIHIGHSGPL
jgi:hypothetical protein